MVVVAQFVGRNSSVVEVEVGSAIAVVFGVVDEDFVVVRDNSWGREWDKEASAVLQDCSSWS